MSVSIPGQPYIEMMAMPWAIGLFVMDWASYERFLIRLLADIEKKEIAAIKEILLKGSTKDFAKQMRASRDQTTDPILKSMLNELLEDHNKMVEVRHNIVHGYWPGLDGESTFIHKRFRKNVGQDEVSRITSADVLKHRNDLSILNGKIGDILVHLGTMKRSG